MPEKNIGGIWIKEGKKGKFFSGSIEVNGEKIRFVAFKNNYKEGSQPDYRIFPAQKREDEDAF